jgi:hypothetical protein
MPPDETDAFRDPVSMPTNVWSFARRKNYATSLERLGYFNAKDKANSRRPLKNGASSMYNSTANQSLSEL